MFLLVDKPQWYTSFDVVEKIKRLYRPEKVGHAGTLDPMATGLLIIGIWKDTKKLWEITWANKTYVATIDFSKSSDTRDMDYWKEFHQREIDMQSSILHIQDREVVFPRIEQITPLLDSIIGEHRLPLTPFSARKVRGKKLYEYARAGSPMFFDVPMTVYSYQIVSYAFPLLDIQISVGSGTYIRSIAYRLGRELSVGGILTMLRRTQIAGYHLPV